MSETWHLVTCEYPPQVGGVSDYSLVLARALGSSGRQVHVWCPGTAGSDPPTTDGVTVHRALGRMTPSDLRRVGRLIDQSPAPRRLLVQWVPHGYGYRSLNLPFAFWVAHRAAVEGEQLDLVVHEPYLAWSLRPTHAAAAAVHRVMLALAASRAARLWVTIPAWTRNVRACTGNVAPILWLPVPSPIPVADDSAEVARLRRSLAPDGRPLVGHFGSHSPLITDLLGPALQEILAANPDARAVLIGKGSAEFKQHLSPQLGARVHATGIVDPRGLSLHIAACDVMLQPYPDGISSRRTTAVALAAHGRAMVTNEGRLSDAVWRESGAVALVSSPAPDALASAVTALIGDADRRRRLGAAAAHLYDRVFDVRHAIAALTEGDRKPILIHEEAAAL